MNYQRIVCSIALTMAFAIGVSSAQAAEPMHGQSMFGDLKYGADFKHFAYANPDAIKGGSVTLATIGSYDTLNPFTLKGRAAIGAGLVYDTLTANAFDEPFSVYGVLAETIEVPDDKRWVTFNLRKEARWHDGVALTAEDVVWTFNTLMEKGHPLYKNYYRSVSGVEALDTHSVKFSFNEGYNAELPLIIGQLAIMPKHYWQDRDFDKTTLEPPLGSGPYKFGKVDPGRSINYARVEDYWGAAVPAKVGRHNFNRLRYDYYRDGTVALEALKSGDVDFRQEYISKNWSVAYDFDAVNEGRIVKEELPDESMQPMQAFVFNLRDPKFQDIRVRQALAYAFDFEWLNENLFYGAYERTKSYFQNSEMQAKGLPQGGELEILERFRDRVPASVFGEEFTLPETDGSGNLRKNYRQAIKLFKAAGYAIKNGKLANIESGEVFTMDMIIRQPSVEKIGLAYKKALERLGIDLSVRVIDSAQYEKRMEDFDFDITTSIWIQSQSPGNEQVDYWGSSSADVPGSRNVMGIKNPVVDELIELIVAAKSREELVNTAMALDRVLLHNHYLMPQYFGPTYRVAYWNKLERPDVMPESQLGFDTWWINPDKAAALNQ